jgi:hypothetical protein
LIVPHPYYRVNPTRAVHITGQINRDLVSRIAPEILKLQASSRDPITVYIDSPGGTVSSMETILKTLRLTDQDSSDPCHIITAVTTRAASAAADLLSSGDYAVAYPHSAILYHGIRTQESNPLTVESASALNSLLRRTNDRYAIELARKIDARFSFRFVTARNLQNGFAEIRQKHSNSELSDVECFIEFIEGKLSSTGIKLWQRVKDRHSRYREIFETLLKKIKGNLDKMSVAQLQAVALKAIVEYEVKSNKHDASWSFSGGGIDRLTEDFFLLNEYLSGHSQERLNKWSADWGKYVVPSEMLSEINALKDENERAIKMGDTVAVFVEPLTSFFAALCHALQEGENELNSEDAYWLGLIDEVVGRDDLLCLRYFEENRPDTEPAETAEEAVNEEEPIAPSGAPA